MRLSPLLFLLPSLAWTFSFSSPPSPPPCGLGFDFGTSGVRLTVLEATDARARVYEASTPWSHPTAVQDAEEWRRALFGLLEEIPVAVRRRVARIAVSGTSASCLVVNRATSTATRPARLYNWDALREAPAEIGKKAHALISEYAPAKHTTLSGTSTLMKVVSWQLEEAFHPEEIMLHQADFLAGSLMHNFPQPQPSSTSFSSSSSSSCPFPRISDWNNMLKLGYDMSTLSYPSWFSPLLNDRLHLGSTPFSPSSSLSSSFTDVLPLRVVEPGHTMGPLSPSLLRSLAFPPSCAVVGGTTDSIAAFLAAGLTEPGQAVTSLGSTLAIKMVSRRAVEDAGRGVYSHRLGGGGGGEGGKEGGEKGAKWLVGGASNVGCAVLREEGFSNGELRRLSAEMDVRERRREEKGGSSGSSSSNNGKSSSSGSSSSSFKNLNYYPLAGQAGERFPTCDPNKQKVLTPRPPRRGDYLRGILEGIARVEKEGYDVLNELGADDLVEVRTAGGGAKNEVWTRMRGRILGVPTAKAEETEAAYGAALLALKTLLPPYPPPSLLGEGDEA